MHFVIVLVSLLSYTAKKLNVYLPKSANQEMYVKHLTDDRVKILFGVGPAGSGKTMFACSHAIQNLKENKIQRIVLTRPIVCVEEDLGFLPGNIDRKMEPWTRPLFDVFHEFCTRKEIDFFLKNGVIEISPLAYMRGRTFKSSFVIADEMQNATPNQMKMLLTRLGEYSKMVLTGDLEQSDLTQTNGLQDFLQRYKEEDNNPIQFVKLNSTDVLRSEVVSRVLNIYSGNIPKENILNVNSKPRVSYRAADNDAAMIPVRNKFII